MTIRFALPKASRVLFVLLAILGLSGLFAAPGFPTVAPARAAAAMQVAVSILPQKYFVQRIAGDLVDVTVMVPPGADPHTYEPKPSQMRALASARLYMTIGVPFEKAWLERITSAGGKDMTLVHLEQGIDRLPEDEPLLREVAGAGQAAEAEDHDHEGGDPHIWLSPALVKVMAGSIKAALVKADPAHASLYRANHDAFVRELDDLDMHINGLFENVPENHRRFMVFHPAWSYFAHNYNLREIPIEVEGREPGPKQLARIMEFAKKEKVEAIFVQPQFSKRSAETIARNVGATLIEADPLAEDWAANIRRVAESMAKILNK